MTPPIAECRSSCRVSPRVTTVATTSFNNEIEEFFSGPASLPRPDLSGLNKIKKTEAKKETDREKDKDGRCNFVRTLSSQTMKASVPVLFFFIPSCRLNDAASVFLESSQPILCRSNREFCCSPLISIEVRGIVLYGYQNLSF